MTIRKYEQEVFDEFAKPANVSEAWSVVDTIAISKNLYGNEVNAQWHTSFQSFGQQERHSFFKQRTQGMVTAAYCNQQSSDSMDFAFVMHSIGLAIFGPPCGVNAVPGQPDGSGGQIDQADLTTTQWIMADLPRHIGLEFKVQQDVRIELPCLKAPPGYGVTGGGVAQGQLADAPAFGSQPTNSIAVSQGVPILSNRYPLPFRIGIPRTASIEGIIHVSQLARTILQNLLGPQNIPFNSEDGTPPLTFFGQRYLIQLSLIGERLVQQRAQYHR